MGRHLELLQLSTDGPIDDKAWRLARELDRLEEASAPRVMRLKIGRISFKPHYIEHRMAGMIADAVVRRGSVHYKDFERIGIPSRLARKHFAAALAKAQVLDPAVSNIEAAA